MKWRIWDIIDLEYFLHQDAASSSGGEQEHLHERDRKIFLDFVQPGAGAAAPPGRQSIIRAWLERRREEAKRSTVVPPGEHVAGIYGLLRVIFLVAGLLLGGGAGASLLTYSGDSPVNVFVYLALFVLSQLLLLLLLFGAFLYRLATKSLPTASPLFTLISRVIIRMLLSARNQVNRKLTAEKRLQAESAMGVITGKTRAYGSLFFLPVFILTQVFAIGGNLSLLGVTLFKVATVDLAFGWQSTIQLSPSAVHGLARQIAWPWSWAVRGDAAFPTLAQVEGSRIILKEGIYHLATPDLVSWWPFLCLAVLVYGLLPRLLLLLGAAFSLRRQLDRLDFRQGSHEQLLLRMTTPLVTTRGQAVGEQDAVADETLPPAARQVPAVGDIAARNLLVLIPDELYDSSSAEEIASVVNRAGRYAIEAIIRTGQEYAADQELIASLKDRKGMADTDLLLIQEAWQPPIMEYIDFIRQLRQATGDGPCIRIGLIGKPGADTIFTPARADHQQIWTRKINAIGDPCLYCEGLVNNAP